MALPTNILTQVQTYNRGGLALLNNINCFVAIANKKFKNFNEIEANLGSVVNFDVPPKFSSGYGLVASFQAGVQRLQPLSCDQAANVALDFTAQERIFNVDKPMGIGNYMETFGKAAIAQLGALIEGNIALNCNSSVPITTVVNGQTVPTGALHTESGPWRFFGNGTSPINSYTQLAQMISNFKDFGSVIHGIKVIIPNTVEPQIVGTGLNQFVPRRNDEIAKSWEVGEFGYPPVQYYISNMLPIQVAGTCGNSKQLLTVVSTNDPSGNAITQITFSGATINDANAVKAGDVFQFNDNVSGQPNLRLLTYYGQVPTAQPVQFRATANAAADGSGNVVVSVLPTLSVNNVQNILINNNIVAGMQGYFAPTHRCGLVIGGDSFYLAMPKLPNQSPFTTASETDPETGVSLRLTTGALLGQNQNATIHDSVWGSTIVPDYCMRILFPV